jgi:hypothetical protein
VGNWELLHKSDKWRLHGHNGTPTFINHELITAAKVNAGYKIQQTGLFGYVFPA